MMKKGKDKFGVLTVGQELPVFKVKMDGQTYRKYNRLIKEINPIHFNKKYALKLGYDGIVVAGNFLFTYIPKWVIDWVGDATAIKKIDVKFDSPVYIDDILVHKGKIIKVDEVKRLIECQYEVEKTNGERSSYGKILLSLS